MLLVLWCFTFQWPGRAASFESQGSCPSPKPPHTPWWSQVECQHHLCKKPDACLPTSYVAYHPFERIEFMFLCLYGNCIYSFECKFFKCSTEMAMHSTHSHSKFVFRTCALETYLTNIYTDHMNGRPHCKKLWWLTCSVISFFSIRATFFQPSSSLVRYHFSLKWHKV